MAIKIIGTLGFPRSFHLRKSLDISPSLQSYTKKERESGMKEIECDSFNCVAQCKLLIKGSAAATVGDMM